MGALEASYAYCRRVARARAKNFYYAFLLLPRAQHDAMCAIYAFMRQCDDLSDEPGATREALERWRAALDQALAGRFDAHPVWPAFHDTVARYQIPERYFHDMIDGVASDLEPRRLESFAALYRYCYQVAAVPGLCTIHVLGFQDARAPELAEKCGVAFQLTNILRDVREDAERGRSYLPAEDLARFGVSEDQVRNGHLNPNMIELLRFQAQRARSYYRESRALVGMVRPRGRASLWALMGLYSRLLERIESSGFDVFARRISLSPLEKLWIVAQAFGRFRTR